MNERKPQPEEESPRTPDPAHLPAGYRLGGKYEIKRLLGEGANGSVYEGEHTEIGHRVAIKIVHKDLAEREDIVARFRREARICATIRNRHVGQVYDVGELPGGAPFMVMELHEGASLAHALREGPLPIATAVEIGRQLLLGLQAAHDIGVVHRDVKPDNVMLVHEAGGRMLVKLVDFGIGKTMVADLRSRAVTLEGMVVGSPDYMPPEQLKGEAVDHRADLYATGVVLYEMITGQVPFDAASLTELFVAILRDPLVPPRTLRPDCPVELEGIILRAMSRAAADRFGSAAEMELALEALQREQTLATAAPARRPEGQARNASRSQLRRVPTDVSLSRAHPAIASLHIPLRRGGLWLALAGVGIFAAAAALFWAEQRPQQAAGHLQRSAGTGGMAVASDEHRVQPLAHPSGTSPAGPASSAPPPASTAPDDALRGAAPGPTERPTTGATSARSSAAATRDAEARRSPRSRAQPRGAAPRSEAREEQAPAAAPEAVPPPAQPSVTELVREAAAAFVRGQLPRARALYREAVARAPDNADAWRGLGMVSSRMGERNEAALAFRRYLALRPGAPDVEAIRRKLDAL